MDIFKGHLLLTDHRKERKEGRKEGRKERRKEGKKERNLFLLANLSLFLVVESYAKCYL